MSYAYFAGRGKRGRDLGRKQVRKLVAVGTKQKESPVMSDEETQQFDWYLVSETEKARQFSEDAEGTEPFWVPRSLIRDFVKYPAKDQELPLCLVEIPEWFAEKEGLI